MGKRVGYEAQAASYGPDAWYALVVPVSTGGGEALALRHARAMKAVLIAVKAWNREMLGPSEMRLRAAEDRLSRAQERLAKIEEEVSRG